jgi:transposase
VRTVILSLDQTILLEIPPLRAAWAQVGEQAQVPIVGSHKKRILHGALNHRTGTTLLHSSLKWNQEEFQSFLRLVRNKWRGWRIVLFLDKNSAHRAYRSRALADGLGIELRWLPTASPELNPLEGLWRVVKNAVLANEATPDMDESLARACEYIMSLSPKERLQKAGTLSGNFWLNT